MKKLFEKSIISLIILSLAGCSLFRAYEPEKTYTVTDIDGNTYSTVQIGEQEWMAENLKVTRYRNREPIQGGLTINEWYRTTEGLFSFYDDDMGSARIYGNLYNWYATIDERGICPAGWRVPTDSDWKELEIYLGMSPEDADEYGSRGTNQGGMLKEKTTVLWNDPNEGATNNSGFSALPGAYLGGDYFIGLMGSWWTSTEIHELNAWSRLLDHHSAQIYRLSNDKREGFSIRCVKDFKK